MPLRKKPLRLSVWQRRSLKGLIHLFALGYIAWLFFADRGAGSRQLLGVLLGLGGALLLALTAPGESGQTTQLAYAGFILLACFCS